MRHEFINQTPVPIDAGPANTIESTIDIANLGGATVADIEVTVDVTHTWTGDLIISLISPGGTEVVLIDREGGLGDDLRSTIFRADAANSITQGEAPFRGTFSPQGDFADFEGDQAEGTWTLRVDDRASQDGGSLNRWVLGLTTSETPDAGFQVEVRFLGGLSPNQQAAFASAAERWSQIIIGDVPPVFLEGETIDDVLIEARGVPIDGPGGILGQAGPRFIRPTSNLPIKGIMSFDTADLDRMEADGSLEDVILHGMAHVLGFGTLWTNLGLIVGEGSIDPTFVGTNAMREYGILRSAAVSANTNDPTPVPVANTGGPGTRDGHWREVVFANELLTGFLSGSLRPISLMSVGAFEDMGYRVSHAVADAYSLPSMLLIAEMGLFGDRQAVDTCVIDRVTPVVVPPSAMVNTLG
jgi:subtilisin-like proprotein convertase family protein